MSLQSLQFWQMMASPLILNQHMNRCIHATYTLVPTISYMKASPHESSFETTPQSLSMSLDFYAIKLKESLTVGLSLWSFPDLSLTAWEPPAKTSNEISALTVVTGEVWNLLFPNLFSSFLCSLPAPSEDLPPFTLAGSCAISSFFPLALSYSLLLFCSFPPLFFLPGFLQDLHISVWVGEGPMWNFQPWLHMPTAGIWAQRRISKFTVVYRKRNIL